MSGATFGGIIMTMGRIILDDIGKGKTHDAIEWFKDQASPKAYIMPTVVQLNNLPLEAYGGNDKIVLIAESALDKLRGVNWEAIVIDELDQFNDPVKLLREIMAYNSFLYVCGTPKPGIGALKLLALNFHECEHTVYYKTPEIAKEMEESYKLICAMWGKPNVHIDEH